MVAIGQPAGPPAGPPAVPQPSLAQPSPAQPSPAQPSPARPGPAQPSPDQRASLQARPVARWTETWARGLAGQDGLSSLRAPGTRSVFQILRGIPSRRVALRRDRAWPGPSGQRAHCVSSMNIVMQICALMLRRRRPWRI